LKLTKVLKISRNISFCIKPKEVIMYLQRAKRAKFPVYKRLCFILFAVLITTSLIMTSCEEPKSKSTVKISINIAPINTSVAAGGELILTATVTASDNKPGEVDWLLSGSIGKLSTLEPLSPNNAKLKVGANESASTLTITVTSKRDKTKSATAKVTVTKGEPQKVLSVTVTPKTAVVARGGTQDFQAEVEVENNAPTQVEWTVSGNTSTKTTVSTGGVLSIDINEGNGPLTVTATSTFDSEKSGSAVVTVLNPLPTPAKPTLDASGVASWNALANETDVVSYTVQLLIGGENVTGEGASKTVDKGSPATYTNDFLSVMQRSAGVYTVVVTANADGVNFANSLPSPASDSQTVIQRPQAVNLIWNGNIGTWSTGEGDTYSSTLGFTVKLYINGSSSPELEFDIKATSKDFIDNIDTINNGIYKFTVTVLGDGKLILGVTEPAQSPEFFKLNVVWLVGMSLSGWRDGFPPGEPMTEENGKFIWEGEAEPGTFRFSLTDTTDYDNKWWGDWFAPEENNTDVTLDDIENDMLYYNGDIDINWSISAKGYYKLIVNPSTMKLRVERPVEVTRIIGIDAPPQLLKGEHFDFSVRLEGNNTELAPVVWEIEGARHQNTSFGTGNNYNRLNVSIDEPNAALTIKVTVRDKTEDKTASVTRAVKSADDFGEAVINFIVIDDGEDLSLAGGLPQNKIIYKTGGVPGTDDTLLFTVNSPKSSYTYTWYVDGTKQTPSASSLILNAADLEIGYHTVRLTVMTDNGVYWSMPELFGFTVAAVRE